MLKEYIKSNINSKMNTIVIHCSATKEFNNITSKEIKKWHLQRGFKDIGYHFVILLDGTIEIGRPLNQQGAHVLGHNSYTIGICYVGGLDANGKPKDTRTPEQKKALIELVDTLKSNITTINSVKGHRDYSKDLNKNGKIDASEYIKACPCFEVKEEFKI